MANHQDFRVATLKEIADLHTDRDVPSSGAAPFYVQVDSVGYMVHQGTLSKPMLVAKEDPILDVLPKGVLVAANTCNQHFFVVQYQGNNSYTINIDNRHYETLTDVSEFFDSDCIFTESSLTLFLRRGNRIYRKIIAL